MIHPTVHLNGTSRETLERQLATVVSALNKAEEAMLAAMPHGRDYYPQPGDAIGAAVAEHRDLQRRLREIRDDYSTAFQAVSMQK